jgi:hypothetical protein
MQGSVKVSPVSNSRLAEVANWLTTNNFPVLPVAPAQDARKHPKIVQADRAEGILQHCPLTPELQPIPLYTGKNPSYLDQNGKPHLINHRQYQKRLPTPLEIETWFANPLNGIGTLGGWNNTIWLDFDVKKFSSQEECDAAVFKILEPPELQQTFIERSHSGGWRVGVRVKEKPTFTNFALQPGGKHIGEALGKGRFTVLAPTLGPSGNPYQSINRSIPVEVMSLESIGIHTSSTLKSDERCGFDSIKRQHQGITPQSLLSYSPGSIPLEQLGTDTSREILNGSCPTGDRSEALATALNEWYGWQNWAKENNIPITGTPEDLAHYAGGQLGIDSERVERILKTIDIVSSDPAALHRGGEESCWKKIRRLDKVTFEAKCPAHIKDDIKAEWQRNSSKPSEDRSAGTADLQQNHWQAPTVWNGEIGWLIEKENENGEPISKFFPKCNFDFQIESELSSEAGGGLVLQVKRSLDRFQKRVIISSQDYGAVKDFEATLKRVYQSGVVCNLKTEHLKALIHVKLREYRNRGGLTYRLQDRAGQQADGHWVFKDCQITKDGVWSAEPNSDWVFNEDLGSEDKTPQPSVAPPNPNALKPLVAAMRKFHGAEGIFPAMIGLGFTAAGVHYQTIIKKERRFPQLNFVGDAGSNKTVCAANALSLVGWLNGDGLMSGVSESKLYECLKLTGSLPLCLDDPLKSRELDEILKRLYNAIPRRVRGNYQEPHSPLMVTSNHAIGDQQLATLTRMLQVPVYRQTDGDLNAWDEMVEAMEGVSGCLPDLIKLGYPKEEIKQLEGELRSHLPKSHPRIASSMALILWYAMAVAKLADFDAESIKQYAITQLCPIANAADSNADSITDFIDKLSALKSDALVGDWNCLVVETKAGKALAIQMSQVFPLVDKHFNPVYSRKVLEALIAKSGGTLQSVQKFHTNRDESLAYYRAKLTAEDEPKEPEYKPKRCVLIPSDLIKGYMDDWKSPTPPERSELPQNEPICEPVTSSVTSVTFSYSQLQEKCNQQNLDTEKDSALLDSLVTSFLEKSTKDKQDVDNSIMFTPIAEELGEKRNNHTLICAKNVTEGNLEAEALIQREAERLHIPCNQGVTGCNQEGKNVTEQVEAVVDTTQLVEEAVVEEWQEEATQNEIANYLSGCTNMLQLATFLNCWNQEAIDEACKSLSPDQQAQIKEWETELDSFKASFNVGDRVYWSQCPGHCEQFAPFEITAIDGDYAKLDLFEKPVLLCELTKV